MLPDARCHFPKNNFILQQDNCPVHNAQIIKEYFATNNVKTMVWPAKCPDVNIIENVWGMMTKKIYDINFRPQNRDTLIHFIEQTWDELSTDPLYIIYDPFILPYPLGLMKF